MQPFFHVAVCMIYIPLVLMPFAPCCQFLKCLIAISRSITISGFFIVLVISATIVFIEDPDNNEIVAMTYHYYQGLLSGKSHLELCYTKGFLPTAKSPSTKGDKNG